METIAVLGIGKLGLCFALNLEKAGYRVIGVDIDQEYVDKINQKTLTSHEPDVENHLRSSQNFHATTSLSEVLQSGCSILFIMVATPSTPEGGYDHSQVDRIIEELLQHKTSGFRHELIIGCTTMPGYCDRVAEKMKDTNYAVSYNPEFIAQGSIIHDQQFPDQVLIGEADREAGDKIEALYRQLCKNEPAICRMDRLSAEICKLATNCFLTTKISFANSIGDLATSVGADADKILSAIGADSRIGSQYLKYGFGFGGPCFPRDNRALGKFASDNGYELLISQSTDEVNQRHLDFQFHHFLQRYHPQKTIVFDHVSYKKGSVLTEESQQLALAVKLAKAGRRVLVKDKKVVIVEVEKQYPGLFTFEITDG